MDKPLFREDGGHWVKHARGQVATYRGELSAELVEVYSCFHAEHQDVSPAMVQLHCNSESFSMVMRLNPVWARVLGQALFDAAATVDLVSAELAAREAKD